MNKDHTPYYIALAMKELGFDEPCFEWVIWRDKGDVQYEAYFDYPIDEEGGIPAPSFQEAFDWFEDEHNICVARSIDTNLNEFLNFTYYLRSWRFPPIEIEFENPYDCFDRQKARVACLEKMIEIVKTQQ